MDEQQKQTTGNDPARRAAVESRMRQALVGWAKAKRHAEASQGTEQVEGRAAFEMKRRI